MRRPVSLTSAGVALAMVIALVTPAAASSGTQHSMVVVSDTSGTWVNHFGNKTGPTVLTYGNIGCSAVNTNGFCTGGIWPRIPGAHWVFNRRNVTPQHAREGNRPMDFTWTFSLPADATDISGRIKITVDNAYRLFVNGASIGHDGELDRKGTDGGWTTVDRYDVSPVPGNNTIVIRAANYRFPAGTPYTSPAGILFRADITYDV